jgi:hypothetical protein
VVHADGRAAAGARVQLDAVRAAADASGAFELRFEPGEIHASAPLVASLPSFWPAIEADWGARLARGEQLSPVRLVLGGASLSIRGRVVDAGGGALAGWEVAVVDATALTPNSFPIEYVEDLAGDGAGRATTSGADGGFELRGLAARAYTLHALDRATLVKVVAEEVPAGSDGVVLRVAADARLERVAGRVVGADGGAIANVRVGVRMNVESAEGARVDWVGAQAVTDEQGRFELASVPRRFAEIALGGDAIVPVRHSVDRLDLAGELVLRAARRCHFRVRVASDSAATSFRLEALDGSEERIEKHQASSWSSFDRLRLVDGVSDVVSAAEGAHVLVLQRGGVEIARRRIELIPGDVAEIGL